MRPGVQRCLRRGRDACSKGSGEAGPPRPWESGPLLYKTERQEFHVAISMEIFLLLKPSFFPKLPARQNGLLLPGNRSGGLESVSY